MKKKKNIETPVQPIPVYNRIFDKIVEKCVEKHIIMKKCKVNAMKKFKSSFTKRGSSGQKISVYKC